jgi:hypothetical protein
MGDFTSRIDGGRDGSGVDGSRNAGFTDGGGEGSAIQANRHRSVTDRVRIDPSRSMKAVTGEVEERLDGLEDSRRRSGALLASELVAQVVDPALGWNSQEVELTIQLRVDAVRLEARGPAAKAPKATTDGHGVSDPIADWGAFIIDRLADRWGLDGGSQRVIWAEIDTPV